MTIKGTYYILVNLYSSEDAYGPPRKVRIDERLSILQTTHMQRYKACGVMPHSTTINEAMVSRRKTIRASQPPAGFRYQEGLVTPSETGVARSSDRKTGPQRVRISRLPRKTSYEVIRMALQFRE